MITIKLTEPQLEFLARVLTTWVPKNNRINITEIRRCEQIMTKLEEAIPLTSLYPSYTPAKRGPRESK